MALTRGAKFVAPSIDIKTYAELNSTSIEAGIFYCVDAHLANVPELANHSCWMVICSSNEDATTLHCNSQLWISVQGANSTTQESNHTMYVRTSALGLNEYTDFIGIPSLAQMTNYVIDYTKNNYVGNNSSGRRTEIYIQDTRPEVDPNITQIWIDTSS